MRIDQSHTIRRITILLSIYILYTHAIENPIVILLLLNHHISFYCFRPFFHLFDIFFAFFSIWFVHLSLPSYKYSFVHIGENCDEQDDKKITFRTKKKIEKQSRQNETKAICPRCRGSNNGNKKNIRRKSHYIVRHKYIHSTYIENQIQRICYLCGIFHKRNEQQSNESNGKKWSNVEKW